MHTSTFVPHEIQLYYVIYTIIRRQHVCIYRFNVYKASGVLGMTTCNCTCAIEAYYLISISESASVSVIRLQIGVVLRDTHTCSTSHPRDHACHSGHTVSLNDWTRVSLFGNLSHHHVVYTLPKHRVSTN